MWGPPSTSEETKFGRKLVFDLFLTSVMVPCVGSKPTLNDLESAKIFILDNFPKVLAKALFSNGIKAKTMKFSLCLLCLITDISRVPRLQFLCIS